MSHRLPDGGHCPGCGGPLERRHRHALDRLVSVFRSVHRYRCVDPKCGWQGVVGREQQLVAARPGWQGKLVWALVGAGLTAAAMTPVMFVMRARTPAKPVPVAPVASAAPVQEPVVQDAPPPEAPGLHHDGFDLPNNDARVSKNLTPLDLRFNCLWGAPGRTPYRGTVEQALKATQMLPPEVVARMTKMAENGWSKGIVEISRRGIRTADGRNMFKPEIPAMGFGNTMCFNTRVNFPAGHVEYAALYEAEDRAGKTYSVMVPYVCNNVSVLGVRAVADVAPAAAVPEPPSWLIVATAIGVMAWLRRASNRRRE
jgi:hypothetical protein